MRKHGCNGKAGSGYYSWTNMIARCERPSTRRFDLYGGRGICVCERWRRSFADFLADMGPPPSPKHSIDRIDSNGHYEPGNCRWATHTTQMRNMSRNRLVAVEGVSRTPAEWSEVSGISAGRIRARLAAGWDARTAIFTESMQTGRACVRR